LAGRKKRRAGRQDGHASDGSDDAALHDDSGQLIVHQSNPLSDLATAFMKLMAPPGDAGGGGAAPPGAPGLMRGGSNGRSDVILCDMGDMMDHMDGAEAVHGDIYRPLASSRPIIQEAGPSSRSAASAGAAPLAMPSIPPAPGGGAAGLFAAGAASLISSAPVGQHGGGGAAGTAGTARPLPEVPSLHNFVPLPGTSLAPQQPSASGATTGGAVSGGHPAAAAGGAAAAMGGAYPGLTITEVTSPMIDMPDLDGFDLGLDGSELDMLPLPNQVRSGCLPARWDGLWRPAAARAVVLAQLVWAQGLSPGGRFWCSDGGRSKLACTFQPNRGLLCKLVLVLEVALLVQGSGLLRC
jgi:hypothetical protein